VFSETAIPAGSYTDFAGSEGNPGKAIFNETSNSEFPVCRRRYYEQHFCCTI